MDFILSKLPASQNQTNATAATPALPAGFLDAVFPGYSVISKIILDVFHFDIGIFVTFGALLFATVTAFTYGYSWLQEAFFNHCTASIDLEFYDDLYDDVLAWFRQQTRSKQARHIKIADTWWEDWLSPENLSGLEDPKNDKDASQNLVFNFADMEAKKPLRFDASEGTYQFWWHWRLFFFRSYKKQRTIDGFFGPRAIEESHLCLLTFGWSTEPLKSLLDHIRIERLNEDVPKTRIRRASPRDQDWATIGSRPMRPLETVTLDQLQKLEIVTDINEFIHPFKVRWYASRGIPYRRGYLFSGPPGTGKTSLSFALAGVFGLSLYVLSLQDSELTEEALMNLFDSLPDRCVVLLEDIDSAGIRREGDGDDSDDDDEDEKDKRKKSKDTRKGISLSSLLNAIDGVTSHEGHILIMSSNHPERLDPALRRPGRVDLHVKFTLASKGQARDIFVRMFTDDSIDADPASGQKSVLSTSSKFRNVIDVCRDRGDNPNRRCNFMPLKELEELAGKFAETMPEKEFSPAEIQGYLLFKQKDPWAAVNELKNWISETRTAHEDEARKAKEAEEKKAREEKERKERKIKRAKEKKEKEEKEKKEEEEKKKKEEEEKKKNEEEGSNTKKNEGIKTEDKPNDNAAKDAKKQDSGVSENKIEKKDDKSDDSDIVTVTPPNGNTDTKRSEEAI